MHCDHARDVLSARFDGEATIAEEHQVDAHLATCADCQAYNMGLIRLERLVRVRSAAAVPDLVDSVVARARPARLGRGGWMRPALAWMAVVMLVQSVPALVLGDTDGATSHLARHLGAFSAALAIGFAYAAWKPHRAFGLLPFTAALVVAAVISAITDTVGGSRTPLSESLHAVEVIGLVLLWMIAGSPGWPLRGIRAPREPDVRSASQMSPTS